jgi:hypothetical protein
MVKVNRLLKPGGIVVVKTPNQDSLIPLLAHYSYTLSAGRYLLPVYSDDHLYRFSKTTLHRLLVATGFEAIKIIQDDNLKVMMIRMQLQRHFRLYKGVMVIMHILAKPLHRENQLLAYGRSVMPVE